MELYRPDCMLVRRVKSRRGLVVGLSLGIPQCLTVAAAPSLFLTFGLVYERAGEQAFEWLRIFFSFLKYKRQAVRALLNWYFHCVRGTATERILFRNSVPFGLK